MDILAPCKAIWTFQHRNFGNCATVRKCPCAEMSPCRNVPVPKSPRAEKSLCQKVPMSKCSGVEMSICQNVCSAKWCTCQNVPVMKHLCQNDSCRNVPCRNNLQAQNKQFKLETPQVSRARCTCGEGNRGHKDTFLSIALRMRGKT